MARPRDTAAAKKARGTYRADRDPDAVKVATPAPECIQSDRAPLPADLDLAGWGAMLRLIPRYDPYALAGDTTFDPAKARAAIDFIETRVVHIKGALARHTFVLEPWQRAVVANMFGWVRPDGTRRFREVLVYIGKKGGKTALVMALTLYLFVADDEPGAEVYCAAAKRDQARIIWDQCKLELARIDPDEQIAQRYQHSIVRPDGGFLKPISADAGTEDGMNPHAVVLDELHRQPDADLVDVCRLSTAARRQPLFIMLTTADEDRESVCNDTLSRAKAVRDNPGDPLKPGFDASFLPVIYEADPEDDWTSPATWRKANPSIGVTVKEEWIARECELAKENPAQEIPFKRYFCNMRTRGSKKWLDLAAWDRCGASFDARSLHGAECIAGLDLSSTTDITALVLYFPATRHVLPWFWVPEEAAKQRDKRNDAIYMRWSRAGLLTLTGGDQLDDERVLNEMEDVVRPFKVREVAIDPWNSLRYTQPLMKRGYNVVQVRQGTYTMNEPLKEIGRLISRRELKHGGHPVLRWMAGNAEIEQDRKGNFALVKPRGGDKIDGMAALATAMARAIVIAPDGGSSVYEERGPIVV